MKNKYLAFRTFEKSASLIRLLGMVGTGCWLAKNLMVILTEYKTSLLNGDFSIIGENIGLCIQIVVSIILFLVLFIVGKPLGKFKEKNDYEIDNFEDTARYSKKRRLPVGQLDENGNMTIGMYLKRGTDNPMQELDKLIGLDEVKSEVKKMQAVFEYEKSNKNKIKNNTCRHYAFFGNPGTGKTTIARIFAGLLYQNGRIKENKYLECTGNDLVGEYEGVTKNKVDAVYRRARGGVLFIDEAYILGEGEGGRSSEAIVQLLVHMESDPSTVVIFAGYTNNMLRFININPGLASRINKTLYFPDYTSDELIKICSKLFKSQGLEISEEATSELRYVFEQKRIFNEENNIASSNGRFARNSFNYIYEQHALNCVSNKVPNEQNTDLITEKDIRDSAEKIFDAG